MDSTISFGSRFALLAMWLFCSFYAHSQIITTIAGNGSAGYSGDGGAATAATMRNPMPLIVDDSGNVYFSDHDNLCVRKIDRGGIITTIAGNGTSGFTGDGGPATAATFDYPWGLVKDDTGNLYIGDVYNNRIRKVNPAGIISSWWPARVGGMAIDHFGNIYAGGNAEIRKIVPSPFIITYPFAGNGFTGFSGDGGPATAAQIQPPWGVSRDVYGNVYIADQNNRRIRKVDATTRIITTIAGDGTVGSSGDGGPATAAQIAAPMQAVADAAGNVYIADWAYNVVRKIDASGIISTIAGNGSAGYAGDGGPATAAQFSGLYWIDIDCGNNLYLADAGNRRIRKIIQNNPPVFTAGASLSITICRDSVLDMSSSLAVVDSDMYQLLTWDSVTSPLHGTLTPHYTTSATGAAIIPSGIVYTPPTGFSGSDSFKIMVTDCGWDRDTVAVYITIADTPIVAPIAGSDSVCVGHTVNFTDPTSAGTWATNNARATITGSGTLTGMIAGSDTVSYSVSNTCGTTTVMRAIRIVNCPNETGNISLRLPTLVPNPGNGMFTLFVPGGSGMPARVDVCDLAGKKIRELFVRTNVDAIVDLQACPGAYLLYITTTESKYVLKVFVE